MSELPEWTLREMFLFDATMRLGSLTAAAAQLGLSQSASSKLMASLEGKLGLRLFDRQGRQLLPTDAAYRFHSYAREVINVVHRETSNEPGQHEIVVALPPTFAEGFVQAATRRFLASSPRARVIVEVRNTPVVEELVAEGRIDLGLTDGRVSSPNVRSVSFRKSTLAVFFPTDHPLARLDRVAAQDLSGHRIVQLTRRHGSRSHVERLIAKLTDPPTSASEASTVITAIHMAKELNAIVIASAFPIAGFLPDGVAYRTFVESIPYVSRFLLPSWQSPSLLTKKLMTALEQTAERVDLSDPYRP